MIVTSSLDQALWHSFLASQKWSPFLQSMAMGEVFSRTDQDPIHLAVTDGNTVYAICQAVCVPARRGKHLSVPYGPILSDNLTPQKRIDVLQLIIQKLSELGRDSDCLFLRISPFWDTDQSSDLQSYLTGLGAQDSPMHMLAEHLLVLDLQSNTTEEIFKNMRQNTRNLIRRAEREGVEVTVSPQPIQDIDLFLTLHEETRKRHHFTPYTDAFFKAQVEIFSSKDMCSLYIARYNGEVLATSIHMHCGGETSYHHGASTLTYPKIPASTLLQWTAIVDAINRGDHLYNFWGIAPLIDSRPDPSHPFAGVTTFKRGFGGRLLELVPCRDIALSPRYRVTRAFETMRKWQRGF